MSLPPTIPAPSYIFFTLLPLSLRPPELHAHSHVTANTSTLLHAGMPIRYTPLPVSVTTWAEGWNLPTFRHGVTEKFKQLQTPVYRRQQSLQSKVWCKKSNIMVFKSIYSFLPAIQCWETVIVFFICRIDINPWLIEKWGACFPANTKPDFFFSRQNCCWKWFFSFLRRP